MDAKLRILSVEKRFLAYLFKDKKYIALALSKIKKEHLPNYHYIYNMLLGYFRHYRDVITDQMAESYFKKRNLDNNTIVNYKLLIGEFRCTSVNNDAEFDALMDELIEYRKRQDYWTLAQTIANSEIVTCSNDKLEEIEQTVKDMLAKIGSSGTETRKESASHESAKDRRARYEFIKNNPESNRFIPTGFKKIDDAEGGFRPGELIYIIGRKGDGKSVLMLNLAHNAYLAGHNVCLFSLEISEEDYYRRFDARAAQVPSNGLKMGNLNDEEQTAFYKYLDNAEKRLSADGTKQTGIFYVVDVPENCSQAFIETKLDMIEQIQGCKFDMVVVDYAGIMQPNIPVKEKRHEQGQIALDLKRMARSRECCVISGAQMTRKGKEDSSGKDGKVGTEHVAESDQISDHLDWGIAIRSQGETQGKIESFKTRDASPFEFHFTKKYSCMTILELEDGLNAWDSIGGAM